MLDKLFGSKIRVKLLKIFFTHPDQSYHLRDLSRRLSKGVNGVRRELESLHKMGLIRSTKQGNKRLFRANQDNMFFPELQSIFLKIQARSPKKKIATNIKSLGKIKYVLLSGLFIGARAKTDILLVGDINEERTEKFINQLEKDRKQEINYTIMSEEEFEYRKAIGDRFLDRLMKGKKIVVVDKLKK